MKTSAEYTECRKMQKDKVGLSSKLNENNRGSFFFQPKSSFNQPGDIYEKQADAMADKVMRKSPGEIENSFIHPLSNIQRKCRACEEEENKLLRKEKNNENAGDSYELQNYIGSFNTKGESLPAVTREFFEPRFGHDFSNVKIHTDGVAAKSAQSINALAYTSGNNIVFNEGQFSMQSDDGKKLLAHELTHVVQQQSTSGHHLAGPVIQRQSAPAKNYPFSVTYSGCDEAPFTKTAVETFVRAAFVKVRDTNCIKNESLKEDILAEFDGLNIECEQDGDECGMASRFATQTVNLYPIAFGPDCPSIPAIILHEVTHLTEWSWIGHGDLAYSCEESCFPGSYPADPSKCTAETGMLPTTGISGGMGFAGNGVTAKYARFYLGLEKRGPVLSFIHPAFGIGAGLIGEATSGEPGAETSGSSTLISLQGGFRLDPGETGGGYISFMGGPAIAVGSGQTEIGAEAGTALGYRWRWLDVSVDAGYTYDPTREANMDQFFTLGASIKIHPQIRE
jgi:Domain of unknown function (DUF4157)